MNLSNVAEHRATLSSISIAFVPIRLERYRRVGMGIPYKVYQNLNICPLAGSRTPVFEQTEPILKPFTHYTLCTASGKHSSGSPVSRQSVVRGRGWECGFRTVTTCYLHPLNLYSSAVTASAVVITSFVICSISASTASTTACSTSASISSRLGAGAGL